MRATFTGSALDRVAERRTDAAWVAERLADPETRAVVAGPGGVAIDPDDPGRLARSPLAGAGGADAVLLGMDGAAALFAVEAAPDDGRLVGLRAAAGALRPEEAGIAAHAAAVRTWHRTHPLCARCGAATVAADAGHVRRCPACGAVHHPRLDPVVIMLVVDGDRVLLGRQPQWPAGRYSALAGFVEPGESLEEAVAREVFEESGVTVRDARYAGSQPWPFPASLMIGFIAEHAAGEPEPRDGELEDARWFTRAQVEAAVAGRGTFGVPPAEAIARRLIEHWLR